MGNSPAKQKFSSMEKVNKVVGTDSRFHFWNVYDATLVHGQDRNVSVFEFFTHPENNKKNIPKSTLRGSDQKEFQPISEHDMKLGSQLAKTAQRSVKQLRHPSIIKFVDSLDLSDNHFYLATEPVFPLRNIIHTLEYSEVIFGFNQLAIALNWLNNNCKLCYNNLQIDSIYVSKDKQHRWILGDFQFALPYDGLNKEVLQETKEIRSSDTITPEEGMKEFKKYDIHTRDVWGFAKFISRTLSELAELHYKTTGNRVDYLSNFMANEDTKQWMTDALNSDPTQRPSYDKFLKLVIFDQDPFCNIMLFFDDLRLKQSHEKEVFFRQLLPQTNSIPNSLMKKRILPRMLTLSFVTEPFASHFLPYLFTLQPDSDELRTPVTPSSRVIGLLNNDDYVTYVIPFIRKCYQSRNLSLRIRVLQNMEYYLWAIPAEIVSGELIAEILLGLRDQDDDLVMFTMNGLVLLARFLSRIDQHNNKSDSAGTSIINETFLKRLHHHCVSSKSIAVRSHALLCMMEMWNIPKIRKDIILSGLHMAIFDIESYEIKLHALNVILVHMQRYDPRELVSLILKHLLPLLLHEKVEVRTKTQQVFKNGLAQVNESDLTHANFGMVSRLDKPSPVVSVEPFYPPESIAQLPLSVIFTGSGPKVSYSFPGTGIVTLDGNTDEDVPSGETLPEQVIPKRTSPEVTPKVVPEVVKQTPPKQLKRKTSDASMPKRKSSDPPVPQPIVQDEPNEEEEGWDKWAEDDKDESPQPEVSPKAKLEPLHTDTYELDYAPPPVVVTPTQGKKKKGLGVPVEDDDDEPKQNEKDKGVDFFSELGMDAPTQVAPPQKKTKKVIVKKMVKKMVPVNNNSPKTSPPPPPVEEEEPVGEAQATKLLEEDVGADIGDQSWGGGDDLGSLDFGDILQPTPAVHDDTPIMDHTPPTVEETSVDAVDAPESQDQQEPKSKKKKKVKKMVKVMVKKERSD